MRDKIEEKLLGRHRNFLSYCKESGKKFVSELDREDFIAYRVEYSLTREQVERIKKLLGFQERRSVTKISSPQNISVGLNACVPSAKNLRFAKKKLGEFLCETALKYDPRIDLFSDFLMTKNLFRGLPEELADKRVQPFLRVCGFKDSEFFTALPDKLTFAEFPAYLVENSIDFDTDKLKNFINALRFDVKAEAKKLSSLCSKVSENLRSYAVEPKENHLKRLERNSA